MCCRYVCNDYAINCTYCEIVSHRLVTGFNETFCHGLGNFSATNKSNFMHFIKALELYAFQIKLNKTKEKKNFQTEYFCENSKRKLHTLYRTHISVWLMFWYTVFKMNWRRDSTMAYLNWFKLKNVVVCCLLIVTKLSWKYFHLFNVTTFEDEMTKCVCEKIVNDILPFQEAHTLRDIPDYETENTIWLINWHRHT